MIRWHEEVGSTQDIAHQLAQDGAAHGVAVAARVQQRGRGTRGRDWVSTEGGLWLSVICRPRDRGAVESFGVRIGLAVAAGIEAATGHLAAVALKWPNDLFVGDRKLAGLLCEARWHGESLGWIVVGLGVNVSNLLPVGVDRPATSLAELGWTGTAEQLAEPLAERIATAGVRADRLDAAELVSFAARDWLRGRRVAAPVAGVAAGIAPSGKLVIETPTGRIEALGSMKLDEG